jgi:beta-glucanase (GH16 family)
VVGGEQGPGFPVRLATRAVVLFLMILGLLAGGCTELSGAAPPALGARMPVRERLVFDEEFNGTRLNAKRWSPYDSPGNGGHGLRRPSAFSLDGHGHLVVTADMRDGRIVSGGMASRFNFEYGRVEVRVRTDSDPTGTTSGVVLTWPESGDWPVDGENDIYETGDAPGTRSPFYSFVHFGATNQQYQFVHDADGTRWQTIVMDWSAKAIRFYLNGAPAGTVTNPRAIPHVPHHVCVQLDAESDGSLVRPVRMYVDYIRVYQLH